MCNCLMQIHRNQTCVTWHFQTLIQVSMTIVSLNVLYSMFVIGCLGDTQFHFRIKCSGPGCGGCSPLYTTGHCTAPLVLMVCNTMHTT